MKIIFNHGKEGSPESRKIRRLQERADEAGHDTVVPDYRGILCPDERAAKLLDLLSEDSAPTVLVGSSMGSYISLVASTRSGTPIRGLFLMAPAFYLPGYRVQDLEVPDCPVEVIHGWRDETVPCSHAIRFAEHTRCRLLMLDDDHRLSRSLEEVEARFVRFLKHPGA